MCGRFANSETIPAMRLHFDAGGLDVDWSPSWNICPTRMIPVMLGDRQSRRLGLMRWGWNPEALNNRLLINCRGEEAHAKRMFKEPLDRRRCLVPATAFYEWRPAVTSKERPQPFAFMPREPGLFAIGGLWVPTQAADGIKGGSVILMTVPANEAVSPVHDRMPLVIGLDQAAAWLDPGSDETLVRSLISPSLASCWDSWPIGRGISDIHRDGPEIMGRQKDA
jgi:putative SOS response-associated peptidase YedK